MCSPVRLGNVGCVRNVRHTREEPTWTRKRLRHRAMAPRSRRVCRQKRTRETADFLNRIPLPLLLAVFALANVFSSGKWALPVAAWLVPLIGLRIMRTSKKRYGFLGLFVAGAAGQLIAWHGAIPFPTPMFVGTIVDRHARSHHDLPDRPARCSPHRSQRHATVHLHARVPVRRHGIRAHGDEQPDDRQLRLIRLRALRVLHIHAIALGRRDLRPRVPRAVDRLGDQLGVGAQL